MSRFIPWMQFFVLCTSTIRFSYGQIFNSVIPEPKTWWAKEVTRELYVAGRLTETQIKYAADTGFKSIISNFVFSEPDFIGEERIPTTDEARNIAENLSGLYYGVVLQPGEPWASVEAVERLTSLLAEAPKPVLYHCSTSRTAYFVLVNYLANQTVYDPDFLPRVNSSEVYRRFASLGHFYDSLEQRQVVADITGEPLEEDPVQPVISNPNWYAQNWLIKPVYDNIYMAGQVRTSYESMVTAVTSDLINLRQRLVESGQPRQEEVTLLNIRDYTGTYSFGGRQTEERLLATRVDPNRTTDYIGPGSDVNYASRNPLEFGDDIGYNKDLDKAFWEGAGITYYNTPISGEYGFDLDMWNAYRDTWLTTSSSGRDTLFQCQLTFRASVGALLTAGYINGFDSNWALQRANELGVHFEDNGSSSIIQLFIDVLDNNK